MKKQRNAEKPLAVMTRNARKAEAMLKLLANAKRLMILCHLLRKELTVSELSSLVGLSSSALSQHLARMREQGIVEAQMRGRNVYYTIASPEVEALLSTLYLIYCR